MALGRRRVGPTTMGADADGRLPGTGGRGHWPFAGLRIGCAWRDRARVLERGEAGREASWAGAGILPPGNIAAPHTADEKLVRLCHDLHPRWASHLAEETGIDNGYRRTGGVYVARSAAEGAAVRQQAKSCASKASVCRKQNRPRWRRSSPCWPRPPSAGILTRRSLPRTRRRSAIHATCESLVAACLVRGVCIEQGVTVEDFELVGGRIAAVMTTAGHATAGSFCVTAGSWTQLLLTRLGITVPVTPIRGQIALLNTGTRLMTRVVNVGRSYLVPRDDGRVLVGSTEEDVGFVKRTTAEAIGELLRFATVLAPGLSNAALEMSWAGLRPASPDGRPFLARARVRQSVDCRGALSQRLATFARHGRGDAAEHVGRAGRTGSVRIWHRSRPNGRSLAWPLTHPPRLPS